jgi:hypothetical protein
MLRLHVFLFSVAALALLTGTPAHSQKFSGKAEITQVGDGVHWELLKQLVYTDKDGYDWLAPKGYKTDGATIPRLLWPVVGSPFTDLYVNAAIIHDVYCDLKSRDWKKVHRTFYDAMIADGVSPIKAKIMYFAVYRFGPKWVVDKTVHCPVGYLCARAGAPLKVTLRARPQVNRSEAEQAAAKINAENPDVSEIERMADDALFGPDSQIQLDGQETATDGQLRRLNEPYSGSRLHSVLQID